VHYETHSSLERREEKEHLGAFLEERRDLLRKGRRTSLRVWKELGLGTSLPWSTYHGGWATL
jgi:hypothetical protein